MSRYRIDARIARLFNTYGPRMAINDGRVVSNFILQSLRTEPLSIYGAGNQTRSLCYVNDTVEVRIAPVLGVLLTRTGSLEAYGCFRSALVAHQSWKSRGIYYLRARRLGSLRGENEEGSSR